MAVSADKFKPSVTPETWMSPVNGCRISTLTTAARFQTLDERFTNPSGKPFTKTQRTKLMKRLRVLASEHRGQTPAAADGYSRDDAVYAYEKAFPGYQFHAVDLKPSEMAQMLRSGWFLSLSGNVSHTSPGCILRAYVNPVDHEIGIARLSADGTKALVYEPMRPDRPVWVKWSDITAFGSEFAFGGGKRVCIAFKIGSDTAEAEALSRLQRVRSQRDDANKTIETLEEDAARLVDDLEACREAQNDCGDAVEAARREALADVMDAVSALMEDTP